MSQQAVLLDINQIGNLMADQPEKTKDSPATVQDLRNMGIAIDANFMVIRSEMTNGFTKVESEIKSVRSEMSSGFAKVESDFKSVRGEAKTESALLRSEMAAGFAKVDARFTTIDAEFKTVRSEMKTGFSDAKESLTRWSMGIFFSVVALVIAVVGSILFR